MRPLKLTLQAFGPYLEKHTLDFGPGSEKAPLLICRPGGSGKTQLIEAIFFSLFGFQGLKNNIRLNISKNIEAGLETMPEVTLDFQSGDLHYRVLRRLETKGTDFDSGDFDCQATLLSLDNKEYIALGDYEITFAIEKILGFESSNYINLVLPSPGIKNPVISI